jgi:ubiquinone/menaquinone biosynthesis C-methylase UbiE
MKLKKFFASYYDYFMKPIEKRYITRWREELLVHAKGEVLEIGAGTGINFPLYKNCNHVIALEPNLHMMEKAETRVKQASVSISLVEGTAEKLPFENNQFDTIVVTLVLCSVDDPQLALEEMKRVLKPDGTVLFLEHVEMEQPVYSSFQKLVTPIWKHICDGCHLNRRTEKSIIDSGFKVKSKQSHLSGFAFSLICEK